MGQKASLNRINYIYIVIHPKFEGWIKLGRSMSLKNRLDTYQTGCPLREYQLVYSKLISDNNLITKIENHFKLTIHNNGFEWFKCNIQEAINIIETMTL